MEPITLCGMAILVFGLWIEFEPAILKVMKALSRLGAVMRTAPSSTLERPHYVKYLAGT
jgi:hypothetical protein